MLGATGDGFFGGAVIFGNDATAGEATITGSDFASIVFRDNATAGTADIPVVGGATVTIGALGAGGGAITATGGDATITAEGGSAPGQGGGVIAINQTATAGNATLIANGGTSGGSGGLIEFNGTASGGTARAIVNAGATLDLRPPLSASVAIGSIEGAGSLLLDGILAAGGNGRSTTFSGIISEGGGLTKEGSGTLTLTGANSYTGATRVAGGTLAGSGCASSALTVEGGGTIAPGASIGTFACTAAVFQSGSTFRVEVGSSGPAADRLDAQGNVTIEAGATLDVSDLASSPVALAGGTLLPIIDYAGHTLTGTFNGLPGGAEFTVGANTFAIGYQAGGSTLVALTAVGGGGNAYALWAGANGIPGDSFDADFDKDGIPNGLEWVLGGNPGGQDPPLVAIAGGSADGLTLIFRRSASSIGTATLAVEWDSGLGHFASAIPIGTADIGPAGSNPTVDIDAPSTGQITVNIPAANAAGGILFARIKAFLP